MSNGATSEVAARHEAGARCARGSLRNTGCCAAPPAGRDGRPPRRSCSSLYRQVRIGLNGRPFQIYKLRTMVPDSDKETDLEVINERTDGPLFKASHDPRVTRVGAVIRALSIDELPQLFNVLGGTMNLVGPRPAIPTEVSQFDPELLRRPCRQTRDHRPMAARGTRQPVIPCLSQAGPLVRRQLVCRTRPLHRSGATLPTVIAQILNRFRHDRQPQRAAAEAG